MSTINFLERMVYIWRLKTIKAEDPDFYTSEIDDILNDPEMIEIYDNCPSWMRIMSYQEEDEICYPLNIPVDEKFFTE